MKEYLGLLGESDGRVILYSNGHSTNSQYIDDRFNQAAHDFREDPNLRGRLLQIMPEDSFDRTRTVLLNTLEPGDIVVVGGGDGTISSIAKTILAHPDKEVRKTPFLALPGGNANLGSSDLLDRHGEMLSVKQLLSGGEIRESRPMRLEIYSPLLEKPTLELAMFISGIGASAMTELEFEKRRHNPLRKFKASRLAVDGLSAAIGLMRQNRSPIDFSINGLQVESGAGVITANTSRYAKGFRVPTSLDEEGFKSIILPKAKLADEIKIASKALLNRYDWYPTHSGETLELAVQIGANQKVGLDTDGEPQILPYDRSEEVYTRILQSVHNEGVNMVVYRKPV